MSRLPSREGWRVSEALSIGALGLFSLVFLVRTAFSYHGSRVYSLFDDSMISMRYARNLANGHGLRWNVTGRAVEGYTNFLWTLWMAVLHLLPVPERLLSGVVVLSGALLLLINLVFVRAIVRRLAPTVPYLPALAMWLVAAYYPLIYWTLRGMEVGLVATLSTAGVLLALRLRTGVHRRDVVLLSSVLGALVLTRDDMLLPALVIGVWTVAVISRSERRNVAVALALTMVVAIAGHSLFRLAYYGSVLPNTYYLKLGGITLPTRLHRGVGGLITIDSLELYAPVTLAVVFLLWRRRRADSSVWLLAGLFVGQCIYSTYVGGDAWESSLLANRYLASEATALLILAVIATHAMVTAPPSVRRRLAGIVAVSALPVLAVRAADWRPASNLQLGHIPTEWWLPRVGLPAGVIAVFAVVALGGARRARADGGTLSAGRAVVGLAVIVLLSMSVREVAYWVRYNAFLQDDTNSALLGLSLRRAALPHTTVAFAAAGGSAYFSQLPAIDLGGKSDAVIAHERPRIRVFIPGHDKYDYEYSVHQLQPDIVVLLGATTATDLSKIRSWGYEPVTLHIYVRRGVVLADRAALVTAGQYA